MLAFWVRRAEHSTRSSESSEFCGMLAHHRDGRLRARRDRAGVRQRQRQRWRRRQRLATTPRRPKYRAQPTCLSRAPMTRLSWAAMEASADSETDAMIKRGSVDLVKNKKKDVM